MDILLNQISFFLTENHLIIIPLLAVFTATLSLLAWKQIKQGWRFHFSKRGLIAQLREKKL